MQLLILERKSIELMALSKPTAFISKGAWDDDHILARHQRLVADTLGDADTGSHRGRLRFSQARHAFGRRHPPMVRGARQGRELAGQYRGLLDE